MDISASTCGFTWSFLTPTDPWALLPLVPLPLPSEASDLPGGRRWTSGTRLPFPFLSALFSPHVVSWKLSHDLLLLPMC